MLDDMASDHIVKTALPGQFGIPLSVPDIVHFFNVVEKVFYIWIIPVMIDEPLPCRIVQDFNIISVFLRKNRIIRRSDLKPAP